MLSVPSNLSCMLNAYLLELQELKSMHKMCSVKCTAALEFIDTSIMNFRTDYYCEPSFRPLLNCEPSEQKSHLPATMMSSVSTAVAHHCDSQEGKARGMLLIGQY